METQGNGLDPALSDVYEYLGISPEALYSLVCDQKWEDIVISTLKLDQGPSAV